uniref:Uncharacterized protein n=1 Tax=Daucus carota subsp. sativus TaxID=79200 RepID=A0A162B0F0_DAUCS
MEGREHDDTRRAGLNNGSCRETRVLKVHPKTEIWGDEHARGSEQAETIRQGLRVLQGSIVVSTTTVVVALCYHINRMVTSRTAGQNIYSSACFLNHWLIAPEL